MPARSTGCIACRRRKIRCDETRPGCARCSTYGIRCPGYSATRARTVEFKDQTNFIAQRAEQRYKTKALNSRGAGDSNTASPSSLSDSSSYATPSDGEERLDDMVSMFNDGSSDYSMIQALSKPSDASLFPLMSIYSPDVERSQVHEQFISTYLPVVRSGAQNGHFSCFISMARQRSGFQALERGMDALSLVQLGSLHKDKRLIGEAVRQYGMALRHISASMARGDFLYSDDVLAAITCVTNCELYGEIAHHGEGWSRHIEGANQLVAARGPQSFKSELSLLLYSNMRHGALLYALISRKTPFMAAPAWRKLAFQSSLVRDESTLFYDIAIQVPGMLQKYDEIDIETSTALSDIDSVLKESVRLESELRSWFAEWKASATIENRNDCELRPIHEFTTFASLVSDRTFQHAYRFLDFLVAYLHSVYWMVMFHIRTNIQSLQKLRHRVLHDWYPSPEDAVSEDELLGYVLSLCQCIPTFLDPQSASAGHIGIFMPMRTAAIYFTEHGHWRLLRWVGEVKNNVFTKGLAPPGVNHAGKELSSLASSPASSASP